MSIRHDDPNDPVAINLIENARGLLAGIRKMPHATDARIVSVLGAALQIIHMEGCRGAKEVLAHILKEMEAYEAAQRD